MEVSGAITPDSMKLVITDSSVFFDIIKIHALPEFFALDFEICTTDFVKGEILESEQKEQIEIIEQFIITQPSIKGKVAVEEKSLPKEDLSDKSLLYYENIISETLVEILIKQGKKEKAIEVLKKLIWKFPQKKAYFAAQIEDLKK